MDKKILISSCLLGLDCAYNLKNREISQEIKSLIEQYHIIPVCPEQLGGLPTPRIPQEIQQSTGKVINSKNEDVTAAFIKGAEETLKIAKLFKTTIFIGKSKSPSCGCGQIYDGSFSKKLILGDGYTTSLLKREKIQTYNEHMLKKDIIFKNM